VFVVLRSLPSLLLLLILLNLLLLLLLVLPLVLLPLTYQSRLIEALLLRLDFESVAIKDATSLANTFNVIHELSTRPGVDNLIHPHAKFRILSIYVLSLSQDIHGILNKLTSFPPEVSIVCLIVCLID
jgi:hypothetical protein